MTGSFSKQSTTSRAMLLAVPFLRDRSLCRTCGEPGSCCSDVPPSKCPGQLLAPRTCELRRIHSTHVEADSTYVEGILRKPFSAHPRATRQVLSGTAVG
jgi:hypothetical protein